jgi:glycosyltransferase involved in cell wall biosynthesis
MKISIISPFYNESLILEKSIKLMISNLSALSYEWEFIIVNDGSCDDSLNIARTLVKKYKDNNVLLISYPINRGRGYALKQGINVASGDIIVTTEIDASWGETIVLDLVKVCAEDPSVEIVIASPHLPGGGYRNVPKKRVLLSTWGNIFIRFLVSKKVTMFTGMTRAYRAEIIKNLPTTEQEKEFHLEVVLKALAFGYKIKEIPCILEWKDDKLHSNTKRTKKRVSSSNLNKLISSHLFFGILSNPVRYLWGSGVAIAAIGLLFFLWGILHFIFGKTAIFLFLTSGSLITIAILLFIFGVLTTQNSITRQELWRIQQDIHRLEKKYSKKCESKIDTYESNV